MTIDQFREIHQNKTNLDLVVRFLDSKNVFGSRNHHKNTPKYEIALKSALAWEKNLKAKEIAKTMIGKTKVIQSFENGNTLVQLLDGTAKKYELAYIPAITVLKGKHTYSLRDPNNIPLISITFIDSLKEMMIIPCPDITFNDFKQIIDFVNTFDAQNVFGTFNRFLNISNEYINFIKNHFYNYESITLCGKEFLYLGNSLKLAKTFSTGDDNLLNFFIWIDCVDAVKLLEQNQSNNIIEQEFKLACSNGDIEKVKDIIKQDLFIEADYLDFLKIAVENNQIEIVNLLLPEIDLPDNRSVDFLMLASKNGFLQIVALFSNKIKNKKIISFGLSSAIENNHFDVVVYLSNWCDKDSLEYSMQTACQNNNLVVVNYFLSKGITFKMEDLETACEKSFVELASLILKTNEFDINQLDSLMWIAKSPVIKNEIQLKINDIKKSSNKDFRKRNCKTEQINQGYTEQVYQFDDGYSVVQLKDQQSRNFEGFKMQNTVGNYPDRATLYSIRNQQNLPECTLLVQFDRLFVITGFTTDFKLAPTLKDKVKEFARINGRHVENCDAPLGFMKVSKSIKTKLQDHFSGCVFVFHNGFEILSGFSDLKQIKQFEEFDKNIFKFLCYNGLCPETVRELSELPNSESDLFWDYFIHEAIWCEFIEPFKFFLTNSTYKYPIEDIVGDVLSANKGSAADVIAFLQAYTKNSKKFVSECKKAFEECFTNGDNQHYDLIRILLDITGMKPTPSHLSLINDNQGYLNILQLFIARGINVNDPRFNFELEKLAKRMKDDSLLKYCSKSKPVLHENIL